MDDRHYIVAYDRPATIKRVHTTDAMLSFVRTKLRDGYTVTIALESEGVETVAAKKRRRMGLE